MNTGLSCFELVNSASSMHLCFCMCEGIQFSPLLHCPAMNSCYELIPLLHCPAMNSYYGLISSYSQIN